MAGLGSRPALAHPDRPPLPDSAGCSCSTQSSLTSMAAGCLLGLSLTHITNQARENWLTLEIELGSLVSYVLVYFAVDLT